MTVKRDRPRVGKRRDAPAAASKKSRKRGAWPGKKSAARARYERSFYVQVGVLLTMIAVLLAGTAVFSVQIAAATRSAEEDRARREAVLSAARQQALNFTTIGYKSVDRDIDRVIDGATGDFKTSYENNRKQVEETVTKNKSTSKGKVLSAGVKSVDDDSAVVLVVVDASVTNVAHNEPTLQNYRMQFDLARLAGGRWLVSGVEFVG